MNLNRNTRKWIPVFFVWFALITKGQDSISVAGGDVLKVVLLDVSSTEVKYKLYDFQDGPIYTVRKSSLTHIWYANGEVENIDPQDSALTMHPKLFTDMELRGYQDAEINYKGKRSGALWVGTGTVLLTPILGWIPPLMMSFFPPRDKNLKLIDSELRKNEEYYRSYIDRAHQIKKEKLWDTYSDVTLFLLFISFR